MMTLERIAEMEDGMLAWVLSFTSDETHELCRLARLGLRVEAAPTCCIGDIDDHAGRTALATRLLEAFGKRVALVVLE